MTDKFGQLIDVIESDDIDFIDVLEAKASGCPDLLNEVSLSRVYRHTAGGKSWAIIMSQRDNVTSKENEANFTKLKASVRSLGLGFSKLKGHWRECTDDQVDYADCPKDKLKDVTEPILFIVGIKQKDAVQLMNRYKQDAIVYSGPETKGKVSLLYRSGKRKSLGSFHPGRIAQGYTELKGGRSFVFEYVASGYMEAIQEHAFRAQMEHLQ
jgi:hypothetical protein